MNSSDASKLHAKPFANCYWVRPGQLLAGEYPLTGDAEDSAVRLQNLLLAGVTHFINLTAADELPAYEAYLPARFGGRPVLHQRFTVADHEVPAAAGFMSQVLDAIDAAVNAGSVVYVHCRAGIGRTGTVVGCYLVRQGYDGAQAVSSLNDLWRACGRAEHWPSVPETTAQLSFIREFHEDRAPQPLLAVAHSRLGSYQGALLGLAIGEVLGLASAAADQHEVAVSNNLAGLDWGASTAMTLALVDSVLTCKQQQPQDQMQRYLTWHKQGQYSSNAQPGVAPPLVQKALGLWQWKRNPLAGSHDPALLDAHPLPRSAAIALYFAAHPARAVSEAAESARTTSQAPLVLDGCRVLAAMLLAIADGATLNQLLTFHEGAAFHALRQVSLKPEMNDLLAGGWRTALTHPAADDVLSVLACAIHALATTSDFQAAIFKAMHKATQPALVGAVCGVLAGALYGVQGLPIVWRETLPKSNELLVLSERLLIAAAVA